TYVLEHPGDDLAIGRLARLAAMSPRHFARVFTREVGTTPARFVAAVRVETARRLLEETTEPLARVCAQSGLGTPEAMRRAFLRALGISPGQYRQRFLRARDPESGPLTTPAPPRRPS